MFISNFISLFLLIIIKFINCSNLTNFFIENGHILNNKRLTNNETIYEVKCNAGYSLNSESTLISYDLNKNKWVPVNNYLIQDLPLCAKICKIKTNDVLIEQISEPSSNVSPETPYLILTDLKKLNLKCKNNNSIVKTQNQQISLTTSLTCNQELRRVIHQQRDHDFIELKCYNVCNVNYLLNLLKNQQEEIGMFYPINPNNPYYLNKESIRFYCNTDDSLLSDYERKVIYFECLNSNWYIQNKNEQITNDYQLANECLLINDLQQHQSSKISKMDYYFRKNFKNLLNLKLNLKLFLIILLISSLLIIVFLMFLFIITFYKRYRMTNYYRCIITGSDHQRARPERFLNRFIRRYNERRAQQRQQQQLQQHQQQQRNLSQIREDQLTFSIGSSSSLNNQNIQQNVHLPTYDEALNKPVQSSEQQTHQQQRLQNQNTAQPPPSPPPSFSEILKETINTNSNNINNNNSNIQSRNDNIDTQSNYSSISAAPALLSSSSAHTKQHKHLRFNQSSFSQSRSSRNNQYLQQQQQQQQQQSQQQSFYDSNETFSLNSAYCINSVNTGGAASIAAACSYIPSEICTIITNSSLNSAESNASKFVLRGSIENNIDQTSLFNYSTSLSDAILHNEVEPLLQNHVSNANDESINENNENKVNNQNDNEEIN